MTVCGRSGSRHDCESLRSLHDTESSHSGHDTEPPYSCHDGDQSHTCHNCDSSHSCLTWITSCFSRMCDCIHVLRLPSESSSSCIQNNGIISKHNAEEYLYSEVYTFHSHSCWNLLTWWSRWNERIIKHSSPNVGRPALKCRSTP